MIENAGDPVGTEKVSSGAGGGRTVLVGVKFDAPSRELLTWALVKAVEPGDTVIALHVLENEIVDRAGKCSSLLSLIKAFDSILDVFEGLCSLKQVDLKLKVCRGSSIRKILVREAKSFSVARVVVGISRHHHPIGSSVSVAKYCSKKLSHDCLILAVNNGKIMFNKEGKEENRRRNQRSVTLNKNTKVVNHSDEGNNGSGKNLKRCSVCSSVSRLTENPSPGTLSYLLDHEDNEKPKVIVPMKHRERSCGSITMLVRQLPESKPGWPLLSRAAFSNGKASQIHQPSSKWLPVVQWVMKLPTRSFTINSDIKKIGFDSREIDSSSSNIRYKATVLDANSSRNLLEELECLHKKHSSTCAFFKYKDLVIATSNFSAVNFIGKGGSSRVFKGCLPDGREIAVKILKQDEDVLKEFIAEIDIITTLHHKNIISLLGFCFEDNNLLLVYNYLARGSLEENLHGERRDPIAFCWSKRYKVAVEVAEALNYLHSTASQPVIHRDVKSSNILLSDEFEPQLSDFGIAKWASISSTYITCSDVAGTFGYLAPEYFMFGKVNDKIDVYAFGVVLLELLSGRKPISYETPKGQESLVMWAKPILDDGKFSNLLDPSLRDDYIEEEMERMALAATLCIRRCPQDRPKMNMVVKLLKRDEEETLKWGRQQVNSHSEDLESLKDEQCLRSDLQSHLNLALLDVEDDSLSMGSIEQGGFSVEDYLKGRASGSSSFDKSI